VDKTLDPADWNEFRKLGHRMMDDICDHLSTLRDQPASREIPAEVRKNLHEPLPIEGQGLDSVYEDFRKNGELR
jgi:hypothetical protein